jgi:hypothetical protein
VVVPSVARESARCSDAAFQNSAASLQKNITLLRKPVGGCGLGESKKRPKEDGHKHPVSDGNCCSSSSFSNSTDRLAARTDDIQYS